MESLSVFYFVTDLFPVLQYICEIYSCGVCNNWWFILIACMHILLGMNCFWVWANVVQL